ncbi:hypothetical protein MA16_Dca002452 [Dendrobium catenatum]|uniref:Reverse transcriptase RNase H-like domain-containing protein n=1 Tax=Dendrobium catenatum TaxID=906689 RepID=A0A2I0W0J6_9ASPA|nr:hypothetical protein MA16_Dca002452 [Dendrobium catenatum]
MSFFMLVAGGSLNSTKYNYTNNEKKLLAIIFAFDKFESYLFATKVIIYTDHSTIKYLKINKDTIPRLVRWSLLLQEFNVIVLDRKENENQINEHMS